MKWIILQEFRRDKRLLVGLLLLCLLLDEAIFVLNSIKPSYAITPFMILWMVVLIASFAPLGLSFGQDKMKNRYEYFLTLPLPRWKVIVSKLLYGFCVSIFFLATVMLLPYPKGSMPQRFKGEMLNLVPAFVYVYLVLIIFFFSSLGAHPTLADLKSYKGNKIKASIILSLSILAPFAVVVIFNRAIADYLIFSIPLIAAAGIVVGVAVSMKYCRYRVRGKSAMILVGIFILSASLLTVFQYAYSTMALGSNNVAERSTAIYMFFNVSDAKAAGSFEDFLHKDKIDNDDLYKISSTFLDYPEKALPAKVTLEQFAYATQEFKTALAITILSQQGENEKLMKVILSRLKSDDKYTELFSLYEWAERLALLCPEKGRDEMIVGLLQSDDLTKRHIGYYAAQFFPSNKFVLPLIESMKTEKRETWLCSALWAVTLIAMDNEKKNCISILDIPKEEEYWRKWYEDNKNETYEKRLSRTLKKYGLPPDVGALSDRDLLKIYSSERERNNRNETILWTVEHILAFRLHLTRGTEYISKFTKSCSCQSTLSIFERKIAREERSRQGLK